MEGHSSCSSSHKEFKIGGHTILFPCKPYPSQFSMMDKIIRGLERHQNCLLESPTGSGKSLALLCSALAWQAAQKRKIEIENKASCSDEKQGKAECCKCSCHSAKPEPSQCHECPGTASTTSAVAAAGSASGLDSGIAGSDGEVTKASPLEHTSAGDADATVIYDDSEEDFKPLKKFREPGKSSVVTKKKRGRVSIEYEGTPPSPSLPSPTWKDIPIASHHMSNGTTVSPGLDVSGVNGHPVSSSSTALPCSQCSCGSVSGSGCAESEAPSGKPKKLPKIFFGTRTHKQVAQIVRELRKTAYHDVPMTILASRDHTCIHPQVSRSANRNEGCDKLLKEGGCHYKDRMVRYQSQEVIKAVGLDTAWDLEDLVSVFKKRKACPYYISRALKMQADLIICPYNYLVDPLIREAMEINLKNQIVMLDEAHNIEDSIREAASQKITQEQIQKALADMDGLIERGHMVADMSKLRQMCHKLDKFVDNNSGSLTQHGFEQAYTMWSGFDIVAQLNTLDLGPQNCEQLKSVMGTIKAAEQEDKQKSEGMDVPALTTATWTLLEQVFLVLRYMYKDNMKYAEDYRMSVLKSIQYVAVNLNSSWLNSRKRGSGRKTPVEVFSLNFWCMSPTVGFADFEDCRSVILTSGTLSPMDTFQSELGQPFPILLEANHVISDSQVWVGAVGEGPDGTSLKAVYRNMESFQFQDSLGQLILSVCQRVPKGILCFLPSYKTLETLTNRWKATGLWERMAGYKELMCEPRKTDNIDFEQIIHGYYNVIHRCEEDGHDEGEGGVDGAVFFAVCRGKVSEGLDFADNFARAVITIGIPYPNFKDLQVELKRKYNDMHGVSRQLLSGSLWYEIQAFRALNQALGRCIRHRNDWGALIIVDDRFVKSTDKYAKGLSKWVRKTLKVHPQCSAMLASLTDFTHTRLQADQSQEGPDTSLLPSTPQHHHHHHASPSLTTPASPFTSTPLPFISPPPPKPSLVDLPPAPDPDSLLSEESRTPLNDVSNASLTVQPPPPPPVIPPLPSSSSSSSPAQSVSARLASKMESSNIHSKGDVPVAQGSQSVKTEPGSVSSLTAAVTATVSQQASVVVVATRKKGKNFGGGGKRFLIKGTAELLHSKAHRPKLHEMLKAQGFEQYTVTDEDPHQKQQQQQSDHHRHHNPVSAVSSATVITAPQATSGVGALAEKSVRLVSAAQAARSVSHDGQTDTLVSGQTVAPTSQGWQLSAEPVAAESAPSQRLLVDSNSTVHPGIAAALRMSKPTRPEPVCAAAAAKTDVTHNSSPSLVHGKTSKSLNAAQRRLARRGTQQQQQQRSAAGGNVPRSGSALQQSFLAPFFVVSKPAGVGAAAPERMQDASGQPSGTTVPTAQPAGAGSSGGGGRMRQANTSGSATGRALPAAAATTTTTAAIGQEAARDQASSASTSLPVSSLGAAVRGGTPAQGSPKAQSSQAGVSSSQTSQYTSSPPLFGDSPSPVCGADVRKMILANPQSQVTTDLASREASSNGAGTVVTFPSEINSAQIATVMSSQLTSVAADTVGNANAVGTVDIVGSAKLSADSKSTTLDSGSGILEQDGEIKPKLKKRLFRRTARRSSSEGPNFDHSAHPQQTAVDGSSNGGGDHGGDNTGKDASSSSRPERDVLFTGEAEGAAGSAVAGAEPGQWVKQKVVRRAKRSSLSLAGSSKRKRTHDPVDSITQQGTQNCLKCAACGYLLLDNIRDSEFERRNNMPSCLKGMADASHPEVLYFKGAGITERFRLPLAHDTNCRRRHNSGGAEARVELIQCPGCCDPLASVASLLGAKVTLSNPNANISNGQMWIFAHKVKISATDVST